MKKWSWFLLSALIILLDQCTKYWAGLALLPYQPVPVMPMVNLTLAYNHGAAFSFLSNAVWARWLFAGFSLVVSMVLIIWLMRVPLQARLQSAAMACILGGAIGNLYDRMVYGYVVDFIDIYYKTHHWPIFNIADIAICIGAILFILDFRTNKEAYR